MYCPTLVQLVAFGLAASTAVNGFSQNFGVARRVAGFGLMAYAAPAMAAPMDPFSLMTPTIKTRRATASSVPTKGCDGDDAADDASDAADDASDDADDASDDADDTSDDASDDKDDASDDTDDASDDAADDSDDVQDDKDDEGDH